MPRISKKHVGIVLSIVILIVLVASAVTTQTLHSQSVAGITSPQNGAVVKGVVPVQWLAKAGPSNYHMFSVSLYIDGKPDGRSKPYATVRRGDPGYSWSHEWSGTFQVDTRNLSNGPHTLLLATGYSWGYLGPWALDYPPITIHVQNGGVSDAQPPSVSITFPQNNASVSGMVPVSFTATDDKGVTKLELWTDGKLTRTIAKNKRDIQWDSKNKTAGLHTLEIRAYDALGQVGIARVQVNVAKSQSPAAPQVKFTNVQQGNIFRGTRSICALATDDKGVTKIEWWVDNRFGGTVYNNSGQAMQTKVELCRDWNSANVPDGAHIIEVRAYDADWNVGKHQLQVVVSNGVQK